MTTAVARCINVAGRRTQTSPSRQTAVEAAMIQAMSGGFE